MNGLVIIGITGLAGTGKTTVAERLCGSRVMRRVTYGDDVIDFDHMTLASPLKELVSIKTSITGKGSKDRRLYEIHRVLVDLYGSPLFGAPTYDQLVNLVYEIDKADVGKQEDHYRRFQQKTADRIKEYNNLAFVNNVKKRIAKKQPQISNEVETLEKDNRVYTRCVIVSDLRYEFEAAALIAMGGKIIKLTAPKNIRNARIENRGEKRMSKKAGSHHSEDPKNISDDIVDLKIDTSQFDADGVAAIVQDFIIEELI